MAQATIDRSHQRDPGAHAGGHARAHHGTAAARSPLHGTGASHVPERDATTDEDSTPDQHAHDRDTNANAHAVTIAVRVAVTGRRGPRNRAGNPATTSAVQAAHRDIYRDALTGRAHYRGGLVPVTPPAPAHWSRPAGRA